MDFISAFPHLKKGEFIIESHFSDSEYYFMAGSSIYVTDKLRGRPKKIIDVCAMDNVDYLFQLQQLLDSNRDYSLVEQKKILIVSPFESIEHLTCDEHEAILNRYADIVLNNGFDFCFANTVENGLNGLTNVIQQMKTCDIVYFAENWNKSTNAVLINLVAENYGIPKIYEEEGNDALKKLRDKYR